MSENGNVGGADLANGGAEGESKPVETNPVDAAAYKRVLDDLHKMKAQARAAQEKASTLEAEKQSMHEQRMADENKHKELAELYKKRLEETEANARQFEQGFYSSKKQDAVYAAAIRAGLRKEAESDLNLLDLEGVTVERTDHGRVLVHGAAEYVENLKKTRPHWFKTKEAPGFNSGGGKSAPSGAVTITPSMLVSLEKKDPVKYREYLKKYLEQRGSKGI